MSKMLITAFAPYAEWPVNAAEETLAAWLAQSSTRAGGMSIETAILPVQYEPAERELARLRRDWFDFTLLLGQSPGSQQPALEMFALNIKGDAERGPLPLDAQGPTALRSQLPLAQWQAAISAEGGAAQVSCHAGTYLCNAVYFWSLRQDAAQGSADRSLFLHLPLIRETGLAEDVAGRPSVGVPLATNVTALELVVRQIERRLMPDHAGTGIA
ncbi:MAG: hypothetical protein WD045_02855 [Pirellulaceae bacterium]